MSREQKAFVIIIMLLNCLETQYALKLCLSQGSIMFNGVSKFKRLMM